MRLEEVVVMKEKRLIKILFLLSVGSLALPWFTYNADVMGYCWGFYFLDLFFAPLIIIAVYLFAAVRNKPFLIITELCVIADLAIVITALARWQEVCNIIYGFHWKDGLYTALPSYWIAVALFLLFFIAFQYDLWKNRLR